MAAANAEVCRLGHFSASLPVLLPVVVCVLLSACRTTSQVVTPTPLGPPPPAAAALEGHLSPQEERELRALESSGVEVTAQDGPGARAVPLAEILGGSD